MGLKNFLSPLETPSTNIVQIIWSYIKKVNQGMNLNKYIKNNLFINSFFFLPIIYLAIF